MPVVYINNLVVTLPTRFAAGDVLAETSSALLNQIHVNRVRAKLNYLLKRGDILPAELLDKATELMNQPLTSVVTSDDDDTDNDDPVLAEAMTIARGLISQKLAQQNIGEPKNLDQHAKALLDNVPMIMEKARRRVELRYKAAESAITL